MRTVEFRAIAHYATVSVVVTIYAAGQNNLMISLPAMLCLFFLVWPPIMSFHEK